MGNTQSNTRLGKLPFTSAEDLSAKDGYLAKITDNSGAAEAALPGANDDVTPFIIEDGKEAGASSNLTPLDPAKNCRVYAKGTGDAGDVLIGAAVAVAADKGKVRKLTATAGTYFSPGIAEEAFVDGQLVRFRPMPRMIVVT